MPSFSDLDEFLAYLLPGVLLVIFCYIAYTGGLPVIEPAAAKAKLSMPGYGTAFLGIFAYLAISLSAGHLCSMWSRIVVQPLVRKIVGDPQKAIFGGHDKKFYSEEFRVLIADKFAAKFGMAMDTPGFRETAPHMIRAHVLDNSSAAVTMRDRIVQTRSLCGNLTLPLILLTAMLLLRGHWPFSLAALGVSVLLAAKQHVLDRREYRAINSYFVVK